MALWTTLFGERRNVVNGGGNGTNGRRWMGAPPGVSRHPRARSISETLPDSGSHLEDVQEDLVLSFDEHDDEQDSPSSSESADHKVNGPPPLHLQRRTARTRSVDYSSSSSSGLGSSLGDEQTLPHYRARRSSAPFTVNGGSMRLDRRSSADDRDLTHPLPPVSNSSGLSSSLDDAGDFWTSWKRSLYRKVSRRWKPDGPALIGATSFLFFLFLLAAVAGRGRDIFVDSSARQ